MIDPTGARSAAHRGADCPRPRTTGRGRNSGSGPDHSQERISKRVIDRIVDVPMVVQRQVPIIQTVEKTVEVPQVQFLDLSGRRACYDAATSANVMKRTRSVV